jgi:hypothetical protein
VDSTQPIIGEDSVYFYNIDHCVFSGDTIIAFGGYSNDATFSDENRQGVVVRSTDGGKTWGKIIHCPDFFAIGAMTSPGKDTILAAGSNGAGGQGKNKYLFSADNGLTWKTNTLILDKPYVDRLLNLTMTPQGVNVGIYGGGENSKFPSVLIRSIHSASKVKSDVEVTTLIYPNPVTTELYITPNVKTVTIFDLLGRRVKEIINISDGKIDCRDLQTGFYWLEAGGKTYKFVKER